MRFPTKPGQNFSGQNLVIMLATKTIYNWQNHAKALGLTKNHWLTTLDQTLDLTLSKSNKE